MLWAETPVGTWSPITARFLRIPRNSAPRQRQTIREDGTQSHGSIPARERIAGFPNGVLPRSAFLKNAWFICTQCVPRHAVSRNSGVVFQGHSLEHLSLDQRRSVMLSHIQQSIVHFLQREDGPTSVEYAVMLALIIVVCIGAITTLGQNANATFTSAGSAVGSASS
jgi:pilus assembly protein Flp/PilA